MHRLNVLPSLVLIVAFAGATVSCNRSATYYVERGNALAKSGHYDDAEINYRKAIQKDPQSGEAYYRLALANLKAAAYVDAYNALVRAVTLLPDRQDIAVELGNLCLALYVPNPQRPQFLFDRLTKISQQLLSKDPRSFDGLRFQGNLAETNGKPQEAIDLFRQADRIKPMQASVIVPLVSTLFSTGQSAEGEKLDLELLKQQPNLGLVYDQLYTHYMAQKRTDEGENLLLARLRSNPKDREGLLLLAFHYAGQHKEAPQTATLQKMLDDRKSFPRARQDVGDFYVQLKNNGEALHQFQEGVREDRANRGVYLKRIASLQATMGKPEEALKTLSEAITDDPKDSEARTARDALEIGTAKPEEVAAAVLDLEALDKAQPANAEVEFQLGRAYLAQNQLNEAAAQFQKSLSHAPNYLEPLLALTQINITRGNYTEALHSAEQANALAPNNLNALYLRGVALRGTGNYQDARTTLNTALAANPKFTDAQLQLGLVDLAEKKYQSAETQFSKIYDSTHDARALEGLVDTYAAQKEIAKAVPVVAAALKTSPTSVPIRMLSAATAATTGQWDLAIEQYNWVVSNNPRATSVYVKLGQAYQAKGDLNGALGAFEHARQLDPKDARILASAAYVEDALGQHQVAADSYRQALKFDPGNPQILNNLAYLLLESGGSPDAAISMVQQAKQKSPNNPDLDDTMGLGYLKKNMTDAAVQVFKSLVRKHPEQPTYHYHLGMALLQRGDRADGKSELQSALSANPPADVASKIRAALAQN